MVVEILERAGLTRLQAADQFGGRPQLPAAVRRAAARGAEGGGGRACAAIASGAPRPIRCACSTAKWKPTSRSSTSCRAFSITCATPCRAHFDAVKRYLDDRGIAYRSAAAPGARPGLLHAHHLRGGARRAGRAEFGAGRRALRRAGRIARLEGARAGHRLFHRRRPAGDERGGPSRRRRRSICSSRRWASRRCATPACWRAICAAAGCSVEIGRGQAEARHGTGQQAGRALHA